MTTKILLTGGLFATVDDADAPLVSRYAWRVAISRSSSHLRYARRAFNVNGHQTSQFMHRLITGFQLTDHINGNGLDNRRSNLRSATQQQNTHNRRKRFGSSKYKGVTWSRNAQKWQAAIKHNGKNFYLGAFHDQADAAAAYDEAARRLFRDFAALNFPLPGERAALTGEVA